MSTIEWTGRTWNPTTGCDRTSPGCDHCYALTMAGRLKVMGQPKYQRDGDPRTSDCSCTGQPSSAVLPAPSNYSTNASKASPPATSALNDIPDGTSRDRHRLSDRHARRRRHRPRRPARPRPVETQRPLPDRAAQRVLPRPRRRHDPAKRICAGCPVLTECRQYALDAPPILSGVWGGMTGRERREERLRLLSNPDPRAGWTPNSRTADHALHHILEQLLAHPGRWARIAQYRSPGTASMAASKLRTGRTSKPAGVWQFEGRRNDHGGSDLYALHVAAEAAS